MATANETGKRSARLLDLRDSLAARWESIRYGVYRFRQSPLAIVGLVIILLYVVMALAAPWIAPPDPTQTNNYAMKLDFGAQYEAPSDAHPLGTTLNGADIFYGIVWGARISILMGLGVTLSGLVVGTILGITAGYFGGWVDDVVMRITDVFLALPALILAMAFALTLGQSLQRADLPLSDDKLGLMVVALALISVWWPPYTRLVRGQVLSIREMPYVEAARALGISEWRIMMRHVLPNSFSPVIVQMTLDIGSVVLIAAALAFIGFAGLPSNMAEWGSLVNKGVERVATGEWWAVTYPGLAIFGFVLGFNLLGDGLRDLLDPRLRR